MILSSCDRVRFSLLDPFVWTLLHFNAKSESDVQPDPKLHQLRSAHWADHATKRTKTGEGSVIEFWSVIGVILVKTTAPPPFFPHAILKPVSNNWIRKFPMPNSIVNHEYAKLTTVAYVDLNVSLSGSKFCQWVMWVNWPPAPELQSWLLNINFLHRIYDPTLDHWSSWTTSWTIWTEKVEYTLTSIGSRIWVMQISVRNFPDNKKGLKDNKPFLHLRSRNYAIFSSWF